VFIRAVNRMRKVIPLLVALTAACAGCAHNRVFEVEGLSRQDVVQIRALVGGEITMARVEVAPGRWRIQVVSPPRQGGTVTVLIQNGYLHLVYELRKQKGQWAITPTGGYYSLTRPPANFSLQRTAGLRFSRFVAQWPAAAEFRC
jgi:hypothetical protein